MVHKDLGPHTFATEDHHPRHHAWLKRFSPFQRREFMEDDARARWQTAGIIAAAFVFGLVLLGIVLLTTAF